MNKAQLLKLIASAGYDIGFGAKKHFATFDVIEKGPGWLGFVSLVGGVYSLFVPMLTTQHAAAAFVVFGVIALYIGLYGSEKAKYEEAGRLLTQAFHELHTLYRKVESQTETADVSPFVQELQAIRTRVIAVGISKQIFLSDWYAHYKFFWQSQVDWIEEQRPFRLFRDKIPLSAYLVLCFAVAGALLAVYGGGQADEATEPLPLSPQSMETPATSGPTAAGK